MNETLAYLPFNTTVLAQVFVGANFNQKVVLTPGPGPSLQPVIGSGPENKELERRKFVTGPGDPSKREYPVKVSVEYNEGPGWQPSRVVLSRPCSAATFNALFVTSEDCTDEDWNDCFVMFTWTSSLAAGEEEGD